MFLVVGVVPLIRVALRTFATLPLALAMLEAILELPNIERPVAPLILAFSVGFSVFILSSVDVSIGKNVGALAVL